MCLWCFSFAVTSLEPIIGQYGEMLKIPCNSGAIKAEDIAITKWKYVSHTGDQLFAKWQSRSKAHLLCLKSNHAQSECIRPCICPSIWHRMNSACFYCEHEASAICERHITSALCSPGQRGWSSRIPAGQAEKPECLNQRHWWIQGPCEHGQKLQPADLCRQAQRPADFHLHGGDRRRRVRIPS